MQGGPVLAQANVGMHALLVRALHGWHAGVFVAQNRRLDKLRLVVGKRSLFSQMAIVKLTAVPLWKVIAGPAPAN
jgi:hypothetical protein